MARDEFLVFGKPQFSDKEVSEVSDSIRKGWLGTGPKVAQFEKEFSQYRKIPYAAAVNSCTAALHLSCLALELEPGDEVITTALTFCATINAIIHSGAKPVLADIDPKTLNIDPNSIREKINSRTKAILPVHFAGRPCDMDAIMAIAKEHNLRVIEDCAHAIETEYHGQSAGSFGDLACFSFYATKNLATGEGGMLLSANEEMIQRVKILALHGMSADAWRRFSDSGYRHYYVVEPGFKYNMMDLQAAIGIHQLHSIEKSLVRRNEIWEKYQHAFEGLPIVLPPSDEAGMRHARHLYTIQLVEGEAPLSRDEFLEEMNRRKIGLGVHYLSMPEHECYQKSFGWRCENYPYAAQFGRQTVSLPLSPGMSDQDVEDVIQETCSVLGRG